MKEKIIYLRKQGKSVNEISNELNCAKSTVSYHINNVGLGGKISDNKQKISKTSFDLDINSPEVKKIIELRKCGSTYDEIFSKTTIPKDYLKRLFRDLKLDGANFYTKYKNLDTENVIKKYLELKSMRKTAKFFNVDRSTLRKVIPDDIVNKFTIKKINPNQRKENQKKAVIDWRRRQKEKLVEYKGGECEKCGYDKSIQALQFHHLNPDEKDFSISGKSYSFEKMKKEVDKCIMVCANCHIEIHEKERFNFIPEQV